ncbi:MAG TPA: ribulose-phosphate 3-epimerase [Erysipelothrix sp.]|nr:ribulose-phosphate 3-epimerase [Erysipelothrix sp.]
MGVFISPSIMCSSTQDVEEFVRAFEKKKVKNIHFDVMDGHYVNNIMLGTNAYRDLKKMTNIPIDLHFMCMNPEKFLDYFNPQAGDWVCFHPETTSHPHRLLSDIKERGCRAGYAINPGTPVDVILEVIDLLDYILVMAVNPGFAGQKMVDSHLEKLSKINDIVKKSNKDIDIVIDGNTTIENGQKMVDYGATGLVVGTSSLLKSLSEFLENYDYYVKEVSRV